MRVGVGLPSTILSASPPLSKPGYVLRAPRPMESAAPDSGRLKDSPAPSCLSSCHPYSFFSEPGPEPRAGSSIPDTPLPLTPHSARLLEQENEELRRRLASATRRTEALERELEIGQDCLELELGQSREELDKFKDKFRRYGNEGPGYTCTHLPVHRWLAGRGFRDHLILMRKLKFWENDLLKIPYQRG